MQKYINSLTFIVLFILSCLLFNLKKEKDKLEHIVTSNSKIDELDSIRFVNVTTYQAEKKQTDERPFETASGITVKRDMYHSNQEIGYCAVSRDLLNHYFNFHDTIIVPIKGKNYKFIIIDTMNSRIINGVDILTDSTFKLKTSIYIKKK